VYGGPLKGALGEKGGGGWLVLCQVAQG